MDGGVRGWRGAWMKGCVDGGVRGWRGAWMEACVDGGVRGWRGAWMKGCAPGALLPSTIFNLISYLLSFMTHFGCMPN